MGRIYNNIVETVGRTPLVKLNKVTTGLDATIALKCEFFNPLGSVKDRIGLAMIEDAEHRGITPGSAKIRARFHGQHDSREGSIECNKINRPLADRGIIEIGALVIQAFQNNKMVEIPMYDARHWQLAQRAELLTKALGDEPKSAGRLHNIARLGAVSRHAAGRALRILPSARSASVRQSGQLGE